MRDMILVVDYQHDFCRNIARKLRAEHIYCKVVARDTAVEQLRAQEASGVILAGGVEDCENTQEQLADCSRIVSLGLPVLAMGSASLLLLGALGGEAGEVCVREQAQSVRYADIPLFDGILEGERWLNCARTLSLPPEVTAIAQCEAGTVAFGHSHQPLYGVQFQVEQNDPDGMAILSNFAQRICRCTTWWSTEAFIERSQSEILRVAGEGRALCAVSGGVDSTVCALLTYRALGARMQAVIVDNGLLRTGEADAAYAMLSDMDISTARVDVSREVFEALKGLSDMEEKRRAVMDVMNGAVDSFARSMGGVQVMVQGTNYSDIMAGHLPERSPEGDMRIVLPLRELFKDEVRRVAEQLSLPAEASRRPPFPAAGLAMRIVGETTPERVAILRAADAIFTEEIRASGQDKRLSKYFPTLAGGAQAGFAGELIVLRAVHASDSKMLPARLAYDLTERVTERILETVPGVSRVLYDLTPSSEQGEGFQ